MVNPSHKPLHLSCRGAPALTTLGGGGGGGERHLQSLLMGPYICIHFTQTLFILKINFSPTDGILQKATESTVAPLPAAILMTRLRVAEPRYVGTRAWFRMPIAAAPEQRGPPGQTFYLGLTTGYAEREHGLQGPFRTKGSRPR